MNSQEQVNGWLVGCTVYWLLELHYYRMCTLLAGTLHCKGGYHSCGGKYGSGKEDLTKWTASAVHGPAEAPGQPKWIPRELLLY